MVPDSVIIDKAAAIPRSFDELSRLADVAERRQNWSEHSGELRRAETDLWMYPAPRTRPPGLRPGERGYGEAPDGARSPSRSRCSRRTIRIGPWKRSDSVLKEKNRRLDWIDRTYNGNREKLILETSLAGREDILEQNRYPYQLPPGIEHWVLWSRRDMTPKQLCEYVERWLESREPHNVVAWNYDDNRGRRTIDIYHVHVYFQGRDGKGPVFRQRALSAKSTSQRMGSPCSV